ncbi:MULTISPECIES: hypothetical protein [unclassified Streptosporangium]|uniref:hypothetical protein n=1 Tax=unclassified Streptosporangium TaxID=2632669 RepID=UPI002E2BA228|nr:MULTISPECIES: hypothetical protein [unclassified Streptosporangium]
MQIRVVLLSLVVPVLAACGAAGTPSASGSPGPPSESAVYRELIACLRRNGVPNFPDPVVNDDGSIEVSSAVPIPESAEKACEAVAARLPGTEAPEYTAADLEKLRRLARCFRDEGIPDWPDPNARGEFPLPRRLLDLGKPGWRDQLPKCRQYFVGRGIAIVEGPDS